jgi:transcriptional regulator with XRE-family HTH domain
MMSRDVVRIARQRAGLTQQQLAGRSGHPRETIARWETGAREPSLTSLQGVVAACDLDLVINLARRDRTLDTLVADQLELLPLDRLKQLLPGVAGRESLRALRWLARAESPAIAVGAIAGVLQGEPQRPGSGHVDVVASDSFAMEHEMREAGLTAVDTEERWADVDRREPWTLPNGGTIVLVQDLPGTLGYPDLRRSAREVEIGDAGSIEVAHPRDLLRAADASTRESDRARVPALRVLLSQRAET